MKKKHSVLSIVSLIALSIVSLCLLFFLLYLVSLSFTDYRGQIMSTKYKDYTYLVFPKAWDFANYKKAVELLALRNKPSLFTGIYYISMWEQYLNTILYAVGGGFVGALCPCIVAYATTSCNFKFNKFVDGLVLVIMVLPIVGAMPAAIDMIYNVLHIDNSLFGLYFMVFSFTNMYYFMFKSAFYGIPKSLSEAAKLDGASEWTIFVRIQMPLIRPTFLAVLVLMLVAKWNDYQHSMFYAPSMPTAAYGLYNMVVVNTQSLVTEKMAAAVIMTVPVVVLYITFNKYLMGNLTIGGVKG